MWAYIVKRLLQAIPTLLMISFLIFSLLYITPGDPIDLILSTENMKITPETRAAIEHEWGLDRPFLERYFSFIFNAMRGDLGTSYQTGQDVFKEVMARMPATLKLTVVSMILALMISLPLGMLAAL